MTAIAIDTGAETALTIDPNAPDARSQMLTAANAIAAFIVDTEGKLAATAKDWGCNLFRAISPSVTLDALINDSKVAAGWATIGLTDAGKKAKSRLEVYFSNARLVAERWATIDAEGQAAVLAGTSSIHYLAGQFRKADADAKKAATKAAKLAEAEAAKAAEEAANMPNGKAPTETGGEEPAAFDPLAAIAALSAFFADMDEAQAETVGPHVAAMMTAYDARVNALIDAGAADPVEAIAA